MLFRLDGFGNFVDFFGISPIKAVKTDHIKAFGRDMDDEFFDEILSRDGFVDELVILVAIVVESDVLAVIIVDTRHTDNGTTEVTPNVFDNVFRIG